MSERRDLIELFCQMKEGWLPDVGTVYTVTLDHGQRAALMGILQSTEPNGVEWIACSDRMPIPEINHQSGSYSAYVLVWVPWMECKVESLRAAYAPQGEFVGWVGLHHSDQPTHWKPLSPPTATPGGPS